MAKPGVAGGERRCVRCGRMVRRYCPKGEGGSRGERAFLEETGYVQGAYIYMSGMCTQTACSVRELWSMVSKKGRENVEVAVPPVASCVQGRYKAGRRGLRRRSHEMHTATA